MMKSGNIFALCVVALSAPLAADQGAAEPGALAATAAVSSEQQLQSRAEARWKALTEGDLRRAYEFATPGFRQATPFDSYRAQFGQSIRWNGSGVKSVTIAPGGETAEVLVDLSYSTVLPSGEAYEGRRGMKEKWLSDHGQWWFAGD